MANNITSKAIINVIRRAFIAGYFDKRALAKELHVARNTVYRHWNDFNEMERLYPGKVYDEGFFMPRKKYVKPRSPRCDKLESLFPELMKRVKTTRLNSTQVWNIYKSLYPDGYGFTSFNKYFMPWRQKNNTCIFSNNKVEHISAEDAAIFKAWRNSNDRKKWEKAVVIQGSFNNLTVRQLSEQVEVSIYTLQTWILRYQIKGIADFLAKPYHKNEAIMERVKFKEENLRKLLHETPKLHGLNRTTWLIKDLSAIYFKVYGTKMSVQSVAEYLKRDGYSIRKARNVLTSPDPTFREKLALLKQILGKLGPKEKFFSIDEYGPFSIKLKGGRSLVKNDELKTVPAHQKSKGWLIFTAALELSTNQVTHFYSLTKDTDEMIKLIDLLMVQYGQQEKLYLSWDAAIWHRSKKLKEYIAGINIAKDSNPRNCPLVELVPLPSSAQFLNVIESVFSGMSRSIIHNSDYQSVEACKTAIDRYFKERNEHFITNPKRAGKTIWGMEKVKPVFDETQHCKDSRYTW